MKATINIEYGSEELEKFLSNMVGRQLSRYVGGFSPEQLQMFLAGVRQAIDMFVGQVGQQPQRGRVPRYGAPPQGPFGGSFVPPPGFRPGMYESWGPPYPPPGRGPFTGRVEGDPDNVQPIHGEPPHVERCFPVDATRQNEGGIGCCQCATYNGAQRTNCRNCGHKLCVIATPPPQPGEGPVGAGPA